MNESIFVRLPGISNSSSPNYTEYGTKGTEALVPETSSNTRFFDLNLEGYASSPFQDNQTVKYVAALVEVEAKDSPYFPIRDINTLTLPKQHNFRFRGIKESEKFLLFSQSVAGAFLRGRSVLETAETSLTNAEELVYPTDTEISYIYNLSSQILFYEWKRSRKIDARWFV